MMGLLSAWLENTGRESEPCSFCGGEISKGGYWLGSKEPVFMCRSCATGQPVAAIIADTLFETLRYQGQMPFRSLVEFECAFWQAYATAAVVHAPKPAVVFPLVVKLD